MVLLAPSRQMAATLVATARSCQLCHVPCHVFFAGHELPDASWLRPWPPHLLLLRCSVVRLRSLVVDSVLDRCSDRLWNQIRSSYAVLGFFVLALSAALLSSRSRSSPLERRIAIRLLSHVPMLRKQCAAHPLVAAPQEAPPMLRRQSAAHPLVAAPQEASPTLLRQGAAAPREADRRHLLDWGERHRF